MGRHPKSHSQKSLDLCIKVGLGISNQVCCNAAKHSVRTQWPFLYDTKAQRKPELPAGAESQTVQHCVVILIVYSTMWLCTCSANVCSEGSGVLLWAHLILHHSHWVLSFFTQQAILFWQSLEEQFLRKPSNPQTIKSYHSNTGKLTNEIFLAG